MTGSLTIRAALPLAMARESLSSTPSLVAPVGLEPTTFGLRDRYSDQLSYGAKNTYRRLYAGIQGRTLTFRLLSV